MGLLLLFAVLFGGSLFSLRAQPLRGCPACKMTGRRGVQRGQDQLPQM
jgi:hypothetical protein